MKPDYKLIKANIENQQSDLYYSKLWSKFQQGDSTMTSDEKIHLYYGYTFHKDYSPYASGSDRKQINEILGKEKPTKKEFEKLVSLFDASLSKNPFDCRSLYYQNRVYKALSNTVEAKKNMNKINCIMDALTLTGDGLSEETAIHVIAVSHEYDYLFMNDLLMKSQALVNGGYDVLQLNPNKDGLEEIWFDVNQSLRYLDNRQKK